MEQERKRPWRLVGAFGVWPLALYLCGRLSLDDAMERASAVMGARAAAVRLPVAEAAIDVDKPANLELVEAILAHRAMPGDAPSPGRSFRMFRLAHLSDLHIAPLPRVRPRDLMGKRLLGYLSWLQRRRRVHIREILDAMVRDLRAIEPDHVAITGDLVNIALPEEFRQAAAWLRELGRSDWVTVVPGNHDVYVPITRAERRITGPIT